MVKLLLANVSILLAFLTATSINGLSVNDFYRTNEQSAILANGDEEYILVQLKTPIHFYSETYDHIYVNTNGILTFGTEFAQFINLPFPLEYPGIAPLYTNVDTTDSADATSAITYFETQDYVLLKKASDLVSYSFAQAYDFQANSIFVATWKNVGHFRVNNEWLNSFQVAVISSNNETYVHFLYPNGGINWIQGDIGESGLIDIRAQAGFVSEDGRFFTLKGSGTENVKYLSDFSNHGVPGSWLFNVGQLGFEDNVREPDQISTYVDTSNRNTCAKDGKLKCHSASTCHDKPSGFCCVCNDGYYGNGQSCLKDDIAVRVTGKVSGTINNQDIASQLQSYVVTTDGRSYTAISPLAQDIGTNLQLLQVLGGPIGWLFAKPYDKNLKNGYQVTGGRLNHTTHISFENSREQLKIIQRFQGLNHWDQLSVDIDIQGTLPQLPVNVAVSVPDFTEEYNYIQETTLSSIDTRQIVTVDGQEYAFNVDQEIQFEKCNFGDREIHTPTAFFNKISKISANYQSRESALRVGMLNKLTLNLETNPCTDGTAICGDNTVCELDGEDGYVCNCKNGYSPYSIENGQQNCVDIDECASESTICDLNADCYNDPGGYSCRCKDGYTGNGYACDLIKQNQQTNQAQTLPSYIASALPIDSWICDQCSEFATCNNGVCTCLYGYTGNGVECLSKCPDGYRFEDQRCILNDSTNLDEPEVEPFCHQQGCTCPTGYDLVEFSLGQTCRLNANLAPTEEEEEKLPCDVENNCHLNATCEWTESELRNKCICNPGYEGDGYECHEIEVSCLYENICDVYASCSYDEILGKSVCKCEKGYEGDGRYCHLAPECTHHDNCGGNSICDNGVCVCESGFERDNSDFCVPAGSCGGAYCAENAHCQWDNVVKISFCYCPPGFIGDGVKTCKSIPPPCNIRNNCGLYASCTPNYRDQTVFDCVCNDGYFGDGFVCVPEINCVNIPSLCDRNAQCITTASGHQCICNTGFIGNGSICSEPPRYESGFLLLSQGVATVSVPFDGKRGKPVSMSSMAIGLDKDCTHGRVYWSDISSKHIKSVKFDGTDNQPFITEDILSPEGVAVDWISRRLYWTDSTKDTIEVASLDDPKVRAVIIRKHLVNPRGIAVDVHLNKIFWSDWNRNGPKIEWSNLDGSEREILLSDPAVKLPNSLAISHSTGELCFADAGTKKIECIDTYSRSVRTIASNLSYPFGLAITDEHFYWTDWTTKKIESIDLNGNRLPGITSPLFGNHKMYGMTAVTDKCPLFYSQCQINNGDCPADRICLVNQRSPSGKSCKCIDSANNCNELILDGE